MKTQEIFARFHEVAAHPEAQLQGYLKAGKKVVLVAPVYTPEEVIHAMGFVPMGAWGADAPLNQAKEYFPAFLCSIVQSILEMGMKGVYEGAVKTNRSGVCLTRLEAHSGSWYKSRKENKTMSKKNLPLKSYFGLPQRGS